MSNKKYCIKNIKIDYVLAALAATLIIIFASINEQSFLKTLPTLVTLLVQILMVKANRWAFLIGGLNSLLYGISYFSEGLYFSMTSAVAISFPLMLYTFFAWKNKENGGVPKLKTLSNLRRVVLACSILMVWVSVSALFGNVISTGRFVWLDCFCFVAGIIVTIMVALKYVDAQYLSAISSCVALCVWIAICFEDPKNINFLIISIYNFYKIIQMAINWTKIYKRQKQENV